MKGKKAKSGKGDDGSASTSDAVQDEAQPSDKKLSPKQKKKLMKEVISVADVHIGPRRW